jgi:hypothetical protein
MCGRCPVETPFLFSNTAGHNFRSSLCHHPLVHLCSSQLSLPVWPNALRLSAVKVAGGWRSKTGGESDNGRLLCGHRDLQRSGWPFESALSWVAPVPANTAVASSWLASPTWGPAAWDVDICWWLGLRFPQAAGADPIAFQSLKTQQLTTHLNTVQLTCKSKNDGRNHV